MTKVCYIHTFVEVGRSQNGIRIGRKIDLLARRPKKRPKNGIGPDLVASGPVFGRFWGPGRVPKWLKKPPWNLVRLFLDNIFSIFLRFVRSGVFRKGPGPILNAPGTFPAQNLRGCCDTFLQVAWGSWRGLSGSAEVLPGSAADLSNPLAGVPLGYGDSRSGLNKY